ncbi:uncharacterized protein LOC131936071 [Physella acuta]|uniref:uncharacterized protein LOC131936071 n=1 Tax=Physella acuta TaxID=109671 RepID=UPI0027DB4B2A|nr:uncharacterized protein LOC131936071 [Physella acuta]
MSVSYLHNPCKVIKGFSLYFAEDVAFIVIDRGENRLNNEFFTVFNSLLDEVNSNESCKGLVTTGVGKFYGNGLDLEWMTNLSAPELLDFLDLMSASLKRLLCFPLPTLAAINGHAFAGGALLAFAHDLRTMRVDRGWLSFNEVFINRIFPEFLLQMLRDKIGTGKNFSDAVVLGKRYTAEEAFNCGLVSAIRNESLLLPDTLRVLKSFYGKNGYPRDSLRKMKEAVYHQTLDAYRKQVEAAKEKSKL